MFLGIMWLEVATAVCFNLLKIPVYDVKTLDLPLNFLAGILLFCTYDLFDVTIFAHTYKKITNIIYFINFLVFIQIHAYTYTNFEVYILDYEFHKCLLLISVSCLCIVEYFNCYKNKAYWYLRVFQIAEIFPESCFDNMIQIKKELLYKYFFFSFIYCAIKIKW